MSVAYGVGRTFFLPLRYAGTGQPIGAVPTVAVGKDGGAFVAATNAPVAVTGRGCTLTLTAAEMTAQVVTLDVTGATILPQTFIIATDPQAVTLATDQPLYAPAKPADIPTDYAKKEDVQVTVPEPVFAGTVTFSGTVEAPAVTVNPTLTPEESAKLLGAAQEATLAEVKARTDTLDAATGTLTLSFRLLLDSDGDGIADVPAVGVGGVTCHLLAHGTHTRIRESATTDSQGYVYWHGLAAGTYDVDPDAAGYEGVTVAVTIPE